MLKFKLFPSFPRQNNVLPNSKWYIVIDFILLNTNPVQNPNTSLQKKLSIINLNFHRGSTDQLNNHLHSSIKHAQMVGWNLKH